MPKVFEIDVPIKDLPNGLDGFSIAQISDIHVGSTKMPTSCSTSPTRSAFPLKPDLFAVTGDLVDGSVADLGEQVQINGVNAKYGTYFCTGNHEYYSGR